MNPRRVIPIAIAFVNFSLSISGHPLITVNKSLNQHIFKVPERYKLSLILVKSDNIEPQVSITLTSRQKEIIVSSYRDFETDAPRFAELFYQHLFAVEPGIRAVFSKNPTVRVGNLVKMLKIATVSINSLDALVPMLRLLGGTNCRQRMDYYATIGEELMTTLQQIMGGKYNDEINEAWTTYFGILSEMMMRRGQGEAPVIGAGTPIPKSVKSKPARTFQFLPAIVNLPSPKHLQLS